MTTSSLINSSALPVIQNKGSIYGKASITPSPHSFQQSQRGCGSVYTDGTKELSIETTIQGVTCVR